jgi:hypothetical protein
MEPEFMEAPAPALPPPIARKFVPDLEPPVVQRQFGQEFATEFQEPSGSALPCWLFAEPIGLAVGVLGVVLLGAVAFHYFRPAKPVIAAAYCSP